MIGSATRHGIARLFDKFRSRGSYAAILSLVFVAIIVIAVQSYRTIDRELTEVALSRRAAVAQLAAATLSERIEHLFSAAVSRALVSLG